MFRAAPICAVSGNIFNVIPGGSCPWCAGLITKAKLDAEAGGLIVPTCGIVREAQNATR